MNPLNAEAARQPTILTTPRVPRPRRPRRPRGTNRCCTTRRSYHAGGTAPQRTQSRRQGKRQRILTTPRARPRPATGKRIHQMMPPTTPLLPHRYTPPSGWTRSWVRDASHGGERRFTSTYCAKIASPPLCRHWCWHWCCGSYLIPSHGTLAPHSRCSGWRCGFGYFPPLTTPTLP